MCILFIYTNSNPEPGKYQLILATNRDEYFIRPAQVAHRWSEDSSIIGGKDLEPGREGGTWFGVSFRHTKDFKFRAAALLNILGEHREPNAAGRGSIVSDYLRGDLKAEDYIKNVLQPSGATFNGFSFVAVEIGAEAPRIFHYCNITNKTASYHTKDPTIIGFGNSPPHEPLQKVVAGQDKFQKILNENLLNTKNHDQVYTDLRSLLTWKERHLPDPVLTKRAPNTFELLSSVFVQVEGYGTRTHTILMVDADGNVDLGEETMNYKADEDGEPEWISNRFQERL